MESNVDIFQLLELSSKDIKVALITMLMNIKEKAFIINKQVGNLRKEN